MEILQSFGMIGVMLLGGWVLSKLFPTPAPKRPTVRRTAPTVTRPAIESGIPTVSYTVIRGEIEGGR